MQEIKPCVWPGCNGEAALGYFQKLDPLKVTVTKYHGKCLKCGMKGPEADTKEEALAAWNGRDSWISVKDELPEERMIVDGVVDRWDKRVREDVWRVKDEFLTNKPYGVEVVEVTHWKCQTPLPPTPEGK